ncbi:DUF4129 domain-containing protein [Arthrobacter koreensis]|uniref:DUF4129 domain-containing protein n=1 Tax=Arthrobacter koreensis TaxID=199136 RepID=UPI002DB9964F|nr:DUF4129 domain-containing protein [Arthrobacter koreensis]MEB7449043.1 DUF4129 domain-containing protein [Arthrobacter koreensis]
MRTAIFAPPLREVPVEPDADQARRWLLDELSKAEYQDAQPGFMERAVARILEFLEELLSGIQGVGAPAGIILLALGALVILVLAILVVRPRLNARKSPAGLFDETGADQDASFHRSLSEEAAGAGDWDTALTERLRAILRTAEERVILEPRPGRTAHEAGAALSAVFPAAAEEILWLSRRFDEIRYGGSRAAEADVRRAAELDAGLLRAQPAGAGAAALPSLAVPK